MRALLPIATATAMSVVALQAETVDEIIAKNIQARGGAEKLKSVQTLRQTAQLTLGNLRIKLIQENKRGNRVREEAILQGMTQVQAYDGKTAWQIDPFAGRRDPELLSDDDLKPLVEDADIDGELVDYKEKGHRAELVGHDAVEGTDCYKIKLTLKNGDIRYYYLDADSFLELKIETQRLIRGAPQYRETLYGDYEEVNGLYFAFASDSSEKGSAQHQKVTVEKVELNFPLEDSRFSMPAVKVKPTGSSDR